MADIKKFPDSPEAMERLRLKEAWRAEQNKSDAENGRRAWEAIEAWRQEKKERLKKDDREAIARNLWHELEDYKSNDDHGNLTGLFEQARLPLKEKSRLTLQPGKTVKDLRTEFAPYKALIEALLIKTGEELNLLADRVLLGTQFHPASLADLQDARLILEALQVAVESVDQEFKLWDQCKAVAAIRKPREEPYVDAVRRGDEEAAQAEFQWDIYEEDMPHKVGVAVEKWWPLEQLSLLGKFDSKGQYIPGLIEPENAFWSKPCRHRESWAAGIWSGESVFFFPHIYLGSAIEWNGTKPDRPEAEPRWVDMSADPEPFVRFDDVLQEYHVYLRDPKTGKETHGGSEFDWGMSEQMSQAARWLIIYPDLDARCLVPAIFSRGEFMSTELLPLSARLIAEFDNSEHWQYVGRDGAPTLLQRLKDLTGYVTGDFKVMDAWRETAARFHLNPIFRSHPGEAEKILYRRHLERWIAENRRSKDGNEDVE